MAWSCSRGARRFFGRMIWIFRINGIINKIIVVLCHLAWVTLKSLDLRKTTNKALFLFFGRDPKNQRSLA